jgi:p-aminobenzoyl-glutamate transporter AbgT
MARILLSAYVAVAVYFLHGYRKRPTVVGVFASLLWPVALALTLAWLMMLDDDVLRV